MVKAVDRQQTVVCTALTARELRIILHIQDILDRKHGGSLIPACMEALARDQRGTESAHDAGNIRANYFHTGDALKASEHGIVVKGTALYDNVFTQL